MRESVCVCVSQATFGSLSNQMTKYENWNHTPVGVAYTFQHSIREMEMKTFKWVNKPIVYLLARASQLLKLSDKLNRSRVWVWVWSARSGILLLIDLYFKFKRRVKTHVIDWLYVHVQLIRAFVRPFIASFHSFRFNLLFFPLSPSLHPLLRFGLLHQTI